MFPKQFKLICPGCKKGKILLLTFQGRCVRAMCNTCNYKMVLSTSVMCLGCKKCYRSKEYTLMFADGEGNFVPKNFNK